MDRFNYEYGTTPKKLKPDYDLNRIKKTKEEIKRQEKINEKQKKDALKLEKKKHNENVAFVLAIFLILLIPHKAMHIKREKIIFASMPSRKFIPKGYKSTQ